MHKDQKQRTFKSILFSIITLEIALCFFVLFRVWVKYKNVILIGKISKSANSSNISSPLEYYYEPNPGVEIDSSPWLKDTVIWTYNNDSLNDRFDYNVSKDPSTYRIIALGDSFTFGDHVNTQEAWPERLEDLLKQKAVCPDINNFEVINLGLRGFDIQNSVERYRIRGLKYNPDLIIWLITPNDLREVRELIAGRSSQIHDDFENRGILDRENPWGSSETIARNEFLRNYSEIDIAKMQDNFYDTFNKLYGGPLLFATFADLNPSEKDQLVSWTYSRSNTYLLDQLPDIFNNPSLHVLDYHPSALGHIKIAEKIYKYLTENIFNTCTVR